MGNVSITDIARRLGVSPSTVSRALRDHQRISPERREEIQLLARQMGYRPSQIARCLVTGRSHTIGVVVTDVADPFVAEVMKGAESESRRLGYTPLFAMSNRDPEQEAEAFALLVDRQVDGMILISSRAAGRYSEMAGSTPCPIVLVNNDQAAPFVHSVGVDNRSGAALAISHLVGLGHRKIAFVSGPAGGRSSGERLDGYRSALKRELLPCREEWILPGAGLPEDGYAALDRLLGLDDTPTAVLCYNDLAAIGLLAAAAQRRVRVPETLSVIGYDNIALSAFTTPRLTTVEQPKSAMGRSAVALCVSSIEGAPQPDVILSPVLVLRDSAGPCISVS